MGTLVGQVGPALLAALVGWVVLWPVRSQVGAPAYHLSAAPTGVVVFSAASAIATLLARPLDAASIAIATLLMAVTVRVAADGRRTRDASDGGGVRPAGFAITASVIAVLGAAFTAAKLSATSNDALGQFWPLAIGLARGDGLTTRLMAARSALVPSLGAVHILFGADWAYVAYPLLAANMIGVLVWLVGTECTPLSSRPLRMAIPIGAALALLAEPSFVFHAFYVHSHMVSALFLTLSLGAIRCFQGRVDSGEGATYGFLVVAGLAASGLALARPDGLAYVFVPVAAALSSLAEQRFSWRTSAAFFAPLLVPVVAVYGMAYLRIGLWETSKLSGVFAYGLLALLLASSLVPSIVRRLESGLGRRLGGDRLLLTALAAIGAALLVLAVVDTASTRMSFNNNLQNLFFNGGGYGWLWWALVAFVGLSVVSGDALRRGSTARFVFLCTGLYFGVASVVHAATHPGRIGALDSFSRIAFHAVPLLFWYMGAVVARVALTFQSSPEERGA